MWDARERRPEAPFPPQPGLTLATTPACGADERRKGGDGGAVCSVRSPHISVVSTDLGGRAVVSLEPVVSMSSSRPHRGEGAGTLHLVDIACPWWGGLPTSPAVASGPPEPASRAAMDVT